MGGNANMGQALQRQVSHSDEEGLAPAASLPADIVRHFVAEDRSILTTRPT